MTQPRNAKTRLTSQDMSPLLPLRGSLLLAVLSFMPLAAQTHKVDAPERVTRAIAVYEWTGDLAKPSAARLIPVSLFIDRHFEDAGVYLARPVPYALQTGDVYSVERAGEHIGTLNLDFARNLVQRHAIGDDNPVGAWYGYGTFITTEEETKLAAAKAARVKKLHPGKAGVIVGGVDENDDDKPHMVRREASATTPAKTTDDSSRTNTASSTPDLDDDPDRPTLRHRDPADPAADAKKPKKSKEGGYVSPPNTSLNDDPDRPTLHRGIPADEIVTPQLSGMTANLHQAVAVSDAASHDEHVFDREWESSKEHTATLAAIEALARPRIAAYLATNKLAIPATETAPANAPARTSKSAAKKTTLPPPPTFVLTNEHLSGYTLSYGGMPTFIYTVETPVASGGPVYLTMVAQRLPSGELQVALTSTTDATHMDRVPWLRPIDVVDPDWSHRASLLFELRAQTSRQFVLYRLTAAEAEQTFITGIIE
jgi:hypothetical protein